MAWSTDFLTEGYEKSIIGFDVRVKPSIDQQDRSEIPYLGTWYDKPSIRLTIDPLVWPSLVNYDEPGEHNGFDLLDNIPVKPEGCQPEREKVLVAFDLPTEFAKKLAPTFGLKLIPMETISFGESFEFCGFDVVDPSTTSSIFYSFNWDEYEIVQILKKGSLKLNSWGIIDNEKDAIEASKAFDKKIPEHAPFAPCGIWIKKIGKKPDLG